MARSHDLQVMSSNDTQGALENFEQSFEGRTITSLTNTWGDAPSPPKDMIDAEQRLLWVLEYKKKREQQAAASSAQGDSRMSLNSSNGLQDLPPPQVPHLLDFSTHPQYD